MSAIADVVQAHQKIAENRLLENAHLIKHDLCISFDRAMNLAKEIDRNRVNVSQWK